MKFDFNRIPTGRPTYTPSTTHLLKDYEQIVHDNNKSLVTMVFDEVTISSPELTGNNPLNNIPNGVEHVFIGSLHVLCGNKSGRIMNLPMTVKRVYISALYVSEWIVDGNACLHKDNDMMYFNTSDKGCMDVLESVIRLPYGATFEMGDFSDFLVPKNGVRCYEYKYRKNTYKEDKPKSKTRVTSGKYRLQW
jgi:hypothetical protein